MSFTPASLLARMLAFAFDYLVILVYLVPLVGLGAAAARFAPALSTALFSGPARGQAFGFVLITVPVAVYFAVPESSTRQATWGKRRMRLAVVGPEGTRLTRGRSFLRTAVKFIPWELAHLCIWQVTFAADPSRPIYTAGFIAVWALLAVDMGTMYLDGTRQMLHDRLAGAFVVSDTRSFA